MRVPQQSPTRGWRPRRRFQPYRWVTHDIVLPGFHKDHLPHCSTRRAQSQQSCRSFPEHLGGGSEVPVLAQVPVMHLRPWEGGEIEKDLLKNLTR